MQKIFSVLVAVLLSACGPIIKVSQPIVVGQPGTVYESTEAQVSVDVVHNGQTSGDVLVGQTLIYSGVKPGEVKNVGFHCGGAVILETLTLRTRRNGPRTEYIYFRPSNGGQVQSTSAYVDCGPYSQRQKTQFFVY
jgi:hypothetical protein